MADEAALTDTPPPPTPTTGPTEHLDTVEYWRGLYGDAVAEGQRQIGFRDWLATELAALCGGTAAMWKDRAEQDWPHPTEAGTRMNRSNAIEPGTRVLMKARHPHEGRTGTVTEKATEGVALGMYLIRFDDQWAGSAYGFREDFTVIDDA